MFTTWNFIFQLVFSSMLAACIVQHFPHLFSFIEHTFLCWDTTSFARRCCVSIHALDTQDLHWISAPVHVHDFVCIRSSSRRDGVTTQRENGAHELGLCLVQGRIRCRWSDRGLIVCRVANLFHEPDFEVLLEGGCAHLQQVVRRYWLQCSLPRHFHEWEWLPWRDCARYLIFERRQTDRTVTYLCGLWGWLVVDLRTCVRELTHRGARKVP